MKAVAIMTPDPKYLAMKKAHSGTPTPLCRRAKTGKAAPMEQSIPEQKTRFLDPVRTEQGTDQDDKDSRNPHADSTVVLIASFAGHRGCCSCGRRFGGRSRGSGAGDLSYDEVGEVLHDRHCARVVGRCDSGKAPRQCTQPRSRICDEEIQVRAKGSPQGRKESFRS